MDESTRDVGLCKTNSASESNKSSIAVEPAPPPLYCAHCGSFIRKRRPLARRRLFCACGCGSRLDGMRTHALYASDACKKRAYRAQRAEQRESA